MAAPAPVVGDGRLHGVGHGIGGKGPGSGNGRAAARTARAGHGPGDGESGDGDGGIGGKVQVPGDIQGGPGDRGPDRIDHGVDRNGGPEGIGAPPPGPAGDGHTEGTGIGHDDGPVMGRQADGPTGYDIAALVAVVADERLDGVDHGVDGKRPGTGDGRAGEGTARAADGTRHGKAGDNHARLGLYGQAADDVQPRRGDGGPDAVDHGGDGDGRADGDRRGAAGPERNRAAERPRIGDDDRIVRGGDRDIAADERLAAGREIRDTGHMGIHAVDHGIHGGRAGEGTGPAGPRPTGAGPGPGDRQGPDGGVGPGRDRHVAGNVQCGTRNMGGDLIYNGIDGDGGTDGHRGSRFAAQGPGDAEPAGVGDEHRLVGGFHVQPAGSAGGHLAGIFHVGPGAAGDHVDGDGAHAGKGNPFSPAAGHRRRSGQGHGPDGFRRPGIDGDAAGRIDEGGAGNIRPGLVVDDVDGQGNPHRCAPGAAGAIGAADGEPAGIGNDFRRVVRGDLDSAAASRHRAAADKRLGGVVDDVNCARTGHGNTDTGARGGDPAAGGAGNGESPDGSTGDCGQIHRSGRRHAGIGDIGTGAVIDDIDRHRGPDGGADPRIGAAAHGDADPSGIGQDPGVVGGRKGDSGLGRIDGCTAGQAALDGIVDGVDRDRPRHRDTDPGFPHAHRTGSADGQGPDGGIGRCGQMEAVGIGNRCSGNNGPGFVVDDVHGHRGPHRSGPAGAAAAGPEGEAQGTGVCQDLAVVGGTQGHGCRPGFGQGEAAARDEGLGGVVHHVDGDHARSGHADTVLAGTDTHRSTDGERPDVRL